MAVSHRSSVAVRAAGTSSISTSFNNSANDNSVLIAHCGSWDAFTNFTISTPTYNSVTMTSEATNDATDADGDDRYAIIASLVAPDTGNNTLAASFSTTTDDSGLGGTFFDGVDQTTPTSGGFKAGVFI